MTLVKRVKMGLGKWDSERWDSMSFCEICQSCTYANVVLRQKKVKVLQT